MNPENYCIPRRHRLLGLTTNQSFIVTRNWMCDLPHELPNDLTPRIFENKKSLGKLKNWHRCSSISWPHIYSSILFSKTYRESRDLRDLIYMSLYLSTKLRQFYIISIFYYVYIYIYIYIYIYRSIYYYKTYLNLETFGTFVTYVSISF